MKKIIGITMSMLLLAISVVGCASTSEEVGSEAAGDGYGITVVTPSLSGSEDEFRAGAEMAAMFPGIVTHLSLPDDPETEIETAITTIVSAADNPLTKAVVVISGQSGLIPAFQQIKEKNSDIITIAAPVYDEPDMMAQYIDLILDTDWIKRGETIPQKAAEMGATTFIHYSFPTHLSKPLISGRKDMMQETCEALGIEWVEVITPDPQTGDGVEAMQQFLREDIPRQIAEYGTDINIFGSNCPMYDVILDEVIDEKLIMAEQCCPTPTQSFPTVLGLEIEMEDSMDYNGINDLISDKLAECDMTGRISAWPIPVTVYMPQLGVYVAMEMIENGFDPLNAENLETLSLEKFGVEVDFEPLEDNGTTYNNYFVMIMDSIFY